jgi:hypothetical protein
MNGEDIHLAIFSETSLMGGDIEAAKSMVRKAYISLLH